MVWNVVIDRMTWYFAQGITHIFMEVVDDAFYSFIFVCFSVGISMSSLSAESRREITYVSVLFIHFQQFTLTFA